MCIQSLSFSPPFCDRSKAEQTKSCLITKIALAALGAMALLIGALVLFGIPGLAELGSTGGGMLCGGGFVLLLLGICLKYKQRMQPEANSSASVNQNFESQLQSIDFSKITPENYAQYLILDEGFDFETGRVGDFLFCHPESDGRICLSSQVAVLSNGQLTVFGGWTLIIENGQFLYNENGTQTTVRTFSNLKDYFDYLFRGEFDQGEITRNLEYFTLKTLDGKEVKYHNPYKMD